METEKARLTEGPVGRHLVNMTVPVLFGITTMMAQGFIDAWFVGRVGVYELAALSFGFPILMIVTSVAIGLGAGTSSVVARAIGANDHRRARRLSTDSLFLSFVITAFVSLLGVLTIEPLFRLLGAPEDMIPLIRGYMLILYTGVPFVVVGMVGMSSMRATGDTRLPSMLMVLAAVINIALDPILIFGFGPIPAMGLNGAAMAALLARGSIFFGTLYLMRYRLNMISLNKPDPGELKKSWQDILHVGIPAAGTNAVIPIGMTVITAMIAQYGPEAVAGFGVANRIESLTLVVFYALSAVIGPFVGQNMSGGDDSRIQRALNLCAVFCLGSGLLIAAVLASLANFLPTLFSDTQELVSVTRLYLLLVPISYGAYGIVMIMNASFNGMGKPIPAVYISVGRMLVLYVPLAFIGRYYFDVVGIFVAFTIANMISGLIAFQWARLSVRQRCAERASASR
jgi:putative MATE family efflux protein